PFLRIVFCCIHLIFLNHRQLSGVFFYVILCRFFAYVLFGWKILQVDGICCHVECSGEGQGGVLLHGWGQYCSMMRLVQRELEDRYRVVNLDLPGFGDSVPLKKPMSIKEYAMFVRKLMAELGIEDPIIIAHSFGARIALRYAMMY